MSLKIINITALIVSEEISNSLEDLEGENADYKTIFNQGDIRQKLLVYVISKVRNSYALIEESEETKIQSKYLRCCLEQRLEIESLIYKGIRDIFLEVVQGLHHHTFQLNKSVKDSDKCFG